MFGSPFCLLSWLSESPLLIPCLPPDQMATVIESASRTTLGNDTAQDIMGARTVPIITSTTPTPIIKTSAPSPRGEPMDLTTSTDSSALGTLSKSPEGDNNEHSHAPSSEQHLAPNANSMPAPAIAAAAVHQPKIVQTAFIHKLYKYVLLDLAQCPCTTSLTHL